MIDGDASHTACYADSDINHYTVKPFGLVNSGASHQMMVNKLYAGTIRITMEEYVDDILVKSI